MPPYSTPYALAASHMQCRKGNRTLFKDVAFEIRNGQWLFVQGPNGAGKTSLLCMLAGLSDIANGQVQWQENGALQERDAFQSQLHFQGHLLGLKDELPAFDNLLFCTQLKGQKASKPQIMDALDQVGLASRADLTVRYFSQGQKRRLSMARMLLSNAALWILDEPMAALDTAAQNVLHGILNHHLDKQGLLVITSHQVLELQVPPVSMRLG